MIHIVSPANRHRYTAQLAEMHRIRKRLFVDTLHWRGPTVVGDQEFDRYDDEAAEYLMGLDQETGAVRAAIRMRPAHENSLLADVFPHLVSKGRDYVLGPTTWEGTRLVAADGARSEVDKRLMKEVYVAVVAFGLHRGFDRFTGLGDVRHIPMMRAGSWRTTILGPPVADDEGEWFAFEARVDEEALAFARERHNVYGDVLFELPASVDLAPHVAARVMQA